MTRFDGTMAIAFILVCIAGLYGFIRAAVAPIAQGSHERFEHVRDMCASHGMTYYAPNGVGYCRDAQGEVHHFARDTYEK